MSEDEKDAREKFRENLHKAEQGEAFIRDMCVPLWRTIFQACVDKGFDQSQSLALTQTWIMASFGKGVRGQE